jgi:hypothetical protein
MGLTGGVPPRTRSSGRRVLTAGNIVLIVVIAASVVAGAVSFRLTASAETAGGVETPTQFLTHWQQTASEAGTFPGFTPARLSANVLAPTRLPAGSARYSVNAGVRGDVAVLWVLTESTGMAVNTEIELSFVVHYLVGTTASAFTTTLYVETQATAIGANNIYTLYFDTGAATGISYQSQLEISQICLAVGTCP